MANHRSLRLRPAPTARLTIDVEGRRRGAVRLVLCWALLSCHGLSPSLPSSANDRPPAVEDRIDRLVRQLGADQFSVREAAQSELQRLGPVAFDALDQARTHDDVEVAMRARYLLRVMSFDWSVETDSPEVKGALRGFGEAAELDRRNRMDRLAAFEGSRGVAALCRIARFETNPLLSKRAALLVMQQPTPAQPAARSALAQTILSSTDSSKRPAAAWLRLFARTLEDPGPTVDAWQELAAAELQAVRGEADKTDGEIVRDLLRWQSDLLRRIDRTDDALAVARRLIDIVDDSPTELSDLVGWYMERAYWPLVQEVAETHSEKFAESPLLLYRHAESLQRQGDSDNSRLIADRAARMHPQNAAAHVEVAIDLRDRGLFEWAEREFRSAMKIGPLGDAEDVKARYRLSEMLYDVRDPLGAAKVWQELVDGLDTQPEVAARFGERKQFFRSRMHYFYAEHYGRTNDRVLQEEQLELGVKHDETDADVLIAMYRLPDADERWKKRTRQLIAAAAAHFQELNQRWTKIAEQPLDAEQREQVDENLANLCNQFAWLVANTEGDKDEALRCGLRAVELAPKTASYLDTLSHCYFAKQDFENAVRYQTIAVQREPHSQQIRRQLDVFRKALESQRAAAKPAADAPAPSP